MQEIADELYESWVNGNLSWVVEQVLSYTTAKAALLGSLLTTAMTQSECMVFRRMLLDRINTR